MARRTDMTRQEAEDFVYKESGLLDRGYLEEWLDLFTDDGIYWVPIDEDADPEREPSIIYDDAVQRSKRVYQLLQGSHHVQVPPSRTVHFMSNFEVEPRSEPNEVRVRCNSIVYELRPGDHQELQVELGKQRALVARCEYLLRNEGGRWAIVMKRVVLIDRDLPLGNLSFIF